MTVSIAVAKYEAGYPGNLDAAQSGAELCANEISEETSEGAYTAGYYEHSIGPDKNRVQDYMYKAVEDLHNKDHLWDQDHVLLVDGMVDDGYGRVYIDNPITIDGNDYYACRATASRVVRPRETEYMAFHELGHSFSLDHNDGSYVIRDRSDGDVVPARITVMATPYIRTKADENAHLGFFGGRADPPDWFSNGVGNWEVGKEGTDHKNKFSYGSINEIESYLEDR